MNYTRTYLEDSFHKDKIISLDKKLFHHEINVLRKKEGDKFIIFDGKGSSGITEIIELNRKNFIIKIIELFEPSSREGLDIELGQALIKNDPFNFSLQKATELGVKKFSPIVSERVVVKRDQFSDKSRMEKWKQIAKGACEQCGENWIPEIASPTGIKEWSSQQMLKLK